jgi:predicted DNA-binding transcriptional regulator AlpA
MSDTVLIPCGSVWLALSPEQFREALQRGQDLIPEPQQVPETEDRVLDAKGMEALTGIPAGWFLEQARQRKLPHVRAGKYVRFRVAEVLATLHVEVSTDSHAVTRKIGAPVQRVRRVRRHHVAAPERI